MPLVPRFAAYKTYSPEITLHSLLTRWKPSLSITRLFTLPSWVAHQTLTSHSVLARDAELSTATSRSPLYETCLSTIRMSYFSSLVVAGYLIRPAMELLLFGLRSTSVQRLGIVRRHYYVFLNPFRLTYTSSLLQNGQAANLH